MIHTTDLDLTAKDVSGLASADAVAGFLASLGYATSARTALTAKAIGLSGDAAGAVREIELLSEDPEGLLRVVFVRLRSLTAKSRNDLARVLGRSNVDHLLVLTSNFDTLEFVLLDKRKRESRGPAAQARVQVVPLALAVARKSPDTKQLRTIRRFTWTCRDGLEQYDKLRTVFAAAAFAEDYFCNRALFADHFLHTRLREDPAWQDNPSDAFHRVKSLLEDARGRWLGEGEQVVRDELYGPLFDLLGFRAEAVKGAKDPRTSPDYRLTVKTGGGTTAAFVYAWDRWLDGPDFNVDRDTSEVNPGACVVTALEEGVADWIVVTNGRLWRLYSRQAHSRATNFYEVDLAEALVASGDTDPNEAFRYWWLFFRAAAFAPHDRAEEGCWLDAVARGSRDYAKRLGERLKDRVFLTIFPHLAQGFLEDRKRRLGTRRRPTEEELRDTYEATLTFLYRLLFLLYAESRDLLPIREAPYLEASLKKIKEEVAEKAGIAESEVAARLAKGYSAGETQLYDRVMTLCRAMDDGDPLLNVPIYNGGLFLTDPPAEENGAGEGTESRECRIARFLRDHKVPDRHLALAIDRLARDPDEKTFSLVFIDYKSLEVRHLGSIYEGLLEFKLRVAEEDLTTKTEKKRERYIALGKARPKRGKTPEAVVRKGEVYLSNDKAERKASGSYYTPDPIVEYIVEHTVGPVLAEKLEGLRARFRKVRKTYQNELQKAEAFPSKHDRRPPREIAGENTYTHHRGLVDELFDFRVLDPAMGSGHFLVEAVDFITDRVLTFLNQFPVNPVTFMLERMRRNIGEALQEQGLESGVFEPKLTEVNLLKRHVLKRCIYGVDLNPMAVELAKVSLWLDAFTIGAPLSFLDHHLRCGNSLIGATFNDLEKATKGQLFGIDYEPMLRAIRHVLQVNQMADATAAEVKRSASEYDAAREELSGYQIVLDLLVARHFGEPDAPELLSLGHELDLSSREGFCASVAALDDAGKDKKDRKGRKPAADVLADVAALASRPDLRFFHWEIEFPEVFFGFTDADERRLEHKDRMRKGTAGFQVVVGNPPYVRQESIKELKPHLSKQCQSYHAVADLFVYFYDKACCVLRRCGHMGFITSGSWMKASFGRALRQLLAQQTSVHSVIDFGEWQPFPGAEMIRPSVTVLRKGGDGSAARVLRHLTNSDPPGDLSSAVAAAPLVNTAALSGDEWSLEQSEIVNLREKLATAGVPLIEYVDGEILYGIKSGLAEVFVVDGQCRDTLMRAHPSSGEIIQPYLEGRDLRPWYVEKNDRWLIFARQGIDIDAYPAIRDYLAQYYERLAPRSPGQKGPGRKPGSYEWYELQDTVAYWRAFERSKIVWPDISKLPRFSMDADCHYVGNTAYIIPRDDFFLLGVLSTWATWFMISQICQPLRLRAGRWQYRLIRQFMERLPIPSDVHAADRSQIARLAERCNALGPQVYAIEKQVIDRVRHQLLGGAEKLPKLLSHWWESGFEAIRHGVEQATRTEMAGQGARQWDEELKIQREARSAIISKLEDAQCDLNDRVNDAFGLTTEERRILSEAVSS